MVMCWQQWSDDLALNLATPVKKISKIYHTYTTLCITSRYSWRYVSWAIHQVRNFLNLISLNPFMTERR